MLANRPEEMQENPACVASGHLESCSGSGPWPVSRLDLPAGHAQPWDPPTLTEPGHLHVRLRTVQGKVFAASILAFPRRLRTANRLSCSEESAI